MWEINSNNQAFTALIAVALGVFLCIFYDLIRAIRDYKRPKSIIVFILDVLVFLMYAIVVFSFLQLFSNGQPRLYIFVFMGAGFMFCRLTVSYYIAKIVRFFVRKISIFVGVISNTLVTCVRFIEKIAKKPSKWLKTSKKTLEKQ